MAHGAPASREDEIRTTPPTADTGGVGAAVAGAGEPGLTAGEAGRQEAAGEGGQEAAGAGGQEAASQEDEAKGERKRFWPSADAPEHVAKPDPRPPRPRYDAGQEPPKKSAAEYAADWNRRDPEKDRMVAEYQAARRAKATMRATAASTADRPSGAILGGQEGSPATIPFSEAADELAKLVKGRRRQDADAAKEIQIDAYHRDRAQG